MAGYGFNSVVPARGGDIVRLFLTKISVPNSSYPAIAAAFSVEFLFDLSIAIPVLAFAFTQGVFPSRPTSPSCRPSTSPSSPRTRASRCSC